MIPEDQYPEYTCGSRTRMRTHHLTNQKTKTKIKNKDKGKNRDKDKGKGLEKMKTNTMNCV